MKNTPLSAAAANDDLLYVILLDPTANTQGVLPCGQLIAVKKHNRGENAAGKERDFLIELGIISHVHHLNTTTLLCIV